MNAETDVAMIPFSKLVISDKINARPIDKTGLEEFAETIATGGLVQAITVRPCPDDAGKFEILAGRRRYLGMKLLIRDKRDGWSGKTKVPAVVRHVDDAEALALSLTENTERLAMHPVDRHEALDRYMGDGKTVAETAQRFAMTEAAVRKCLALGRLAPEVRKAWRADKISEAVAKAFTSEPRHDLQVAAFERLRKSEGRHISEHSVRHALSSGRKAKSAVAAPVLERYLAAGGELVEDLFEDKSYLADGALLKRVEAEWAEEAIAEKRTEFLAAGWAWVEDAEALPHHWRWSWTKIDFAHELSEEDAARVEELRETAQEADDEAEADRLDAEADAIENRSIAASYTPEQRARSGVVIEITGNGVLDIAYGIIRPDADGQMDVEDDMVGRGTHHSLDDALSDDDGDPGPLPSAGAMVGAADADDQGSPEISQALLMSITEARTKAAAQAICTDARLGLAVAVSALSAGIGGFGCVRLQSSGWPQSEKGFTRGDFVALLKRHEATPLHDLAVSFAGLIADALDLRQWSGTTTTAESTALVAALPAEAYLRAAREHFLPDDYFKRASKAVAMVALEEMREAAGALAPADELAGKKKGDLVSIAAVAAADTGWLPPELRHPAYALVAHQAPAAPAEAARTRKRKEAA